MNVTFRNWMQAVWLSLIEPADMARKIVTIRFDLQTLWTAMALTAIVNVLLIAVFQMISPATIVVDGQQIVLSPFAYVLIIGIFTVLFTYGTYFAGKMLNGQGDLHGTLALLVWFQVISLTLEIIQAGLSIISLTVAAMFSMVSLGGMLWCLVNFVNVLHRFESFGKTILTLLLALIGTALISGMVFAIFGLVPMGTAL